MNLPNISIEKLLEAGVHFGHNISRWNPKMEQYIFGVRNKIHIIDLRITLLLINGKEILRSIMWIFFLIPKIYCSIFGFHLLILCPKWIPASKSCSIVILGNLIYPPVKPPQKKKHRDFLCVKFVIIYKKNITYSSKLLLNFYWIINFFGELLKKQKNFK